MPLDNEVLCSIHFKRKGNSPPRNQSPVYITSQWRLATRTASLLVSSWVQWDKTKPSAWYYKYLTSPHYEVWRFRDVSIKLHHVILSWAIWLTTCFLRCNLFIRSTATCFDTNYFLKQEPFLKSWHSFRQSRIYPPFNAIRRFITIFTTAHHSNLYRPN
jgi:hypothetical protein